MMAGRIPENKIDEIRTAADIVDIISSYVALKKRGRNYLGLCPFHTEKTPSFSVSPDKQIFHCFGCGKGGNVFTFLMEHEHLTFIECVKLLADRYGIILPRYERDPDDKSERLLYANQVAADYFVHGLQNPRYRDKIGQYLSATRGLDTDTIKEFQIGLAPDEWQGLVDFAKKKDVKPYELVNAGLAVKSEKNNDYYDRFRLRLMIPIFNLSGKIVAFGGRALKKGEHAKYMNSPETPIYNKSAILYGLNFARNAIRDAESVILVEGYFDFLSLYQAGIQNVVAVSGTAFTPQQARLIARFAHRAYLFFDADSAGQNAALRSVEYFFNNGIEPVICTPPDDHDPDSCVRELGKDATLALIHNGQPYLTYRFNRVETGAMTMRKKERIVKEIRTLASKIEDPLRREIFVAEAADHLGLKTQTLNAAPETKNDPRSADDRVRTLAVLEAEFLSLLINQPALIAEVQNDIAPEDLTGPGHNALYSRLLTAWLDDGAVNIDRLIESIEDDTERSALSHIATFDWGDLDIPVLVREYKSMIMGQKNKARLEVLQKRLRAAEQSGDNDLAAKLTTEIQYLLKTKP